MTVSGTRLGVERERERERERKKKKKKKNCLVLKIPCS